MQAAEKGAKLFQINLSAALILRTLHLYFGPQMMLCSKAILNNSNHIFHQLLPPVKNCNFNSRARAHTHELPSANNDAVKNSFIHRMLCICVWEQVV